MHFLKQLAKYDSEHSLVDSVSVYINCRRTVLAQCLYEPIPPPHSPPLICPPSQVTLYFCLNKKAISFTKAAAKTKRKKKTQHSMMSTTHFLLCGVQSKQNS